MSISEALGSEREVALSRCRIRYRERGDGPPIVFVHGLCVNGDLWRAVVPDLAAAGYRCITPDWPFGAHEVPAPDADLSPAGAAALVAEFLTALDLEQATVIGNDTGGAVVQLLMAARPDRIGAVVLTTCDIFDVFFPVPYNVFPRVARIPGALALVGAVAGIAALQPRIFSLGMLVKRPVPADIAASYLSRLSNPAIRDDLTRFVRAVDSAATVAAADTLRDFGAPVLLAWGTEDRLFPMSLAERMRDILPNATLRAIDDSYTYVPEDNPGELGSAITEFLASELVRRPTTKGSS